MTKISLFLLFNLIFVTHTITASCSQTDLTQKFIDENLIQAVQENNLENVRKFLAQSANPLAPDRLGTIALFRAPFTSSSRIFALLMKTIENKLKTDKNLQNKLEKLSLEIALSSSGPDSNKIVQTLLTAGINLPIRTITSNDLILIAEHGHHEVMQKLIDSGININTVKTTILFISVRTTIHIDDSDKIKTCMVLITAGAQIPDTLNHLWGERYAEWLNEKVIKPLNDKIAAQESSNKLTLQMMHNADLPLIIPVYDLVSTLTGSKPYPLADTTYCPKSKGGLY